MDFSFSKTTPHLVYSAGGPPTLFTQREDPSIAKCSVADKSWNDKRIKERKNHSPKPQRYRGSRLATHGTTL